MKPYSKVYILFVFLLSVSQGISQDWIFDIEEAKTLAEKQDRNIMLLFTGSDWCPPCIKLKKRILSDSSFIDYAKENLVLLKADFPKRKKNRLSKIQENKNFALAKRYNKKMVFPVLLILDKEGAVLGVTGYQKMSVTRYISLLSSFQKPY